MNNKIRVIQVSAAALMASALVAACGGGGGGDTVADAGGGVMTTVASTTTTTAPASDIVTDPVAAPTYSAASDKLAAYQYLNSLRITCGFGPLQQSARIDIVAQGHADYLVTHNLMGHYEDQTAFPAGFIGADLPDRYAYASYPYSMTYNLGAGEVVAMETARYGKDAGTANVMTLMSAPLHGFAMLLGFRDVGIGMSSGSGRNRFVMNFGSTADRPAQLLAGNAVTTYPCAGIAGLLSKTYANESPAPIPGRNLGTQPIGHPIYLKVRDGQTLTITSADLRVDGSVTALALIKRDKASDTSGLIPDNSVVYYMPDASLATNTTYRFTANGTNNGQAVSINFTFTTGAF